VPLTISVEHRQGAFSLAASFEVPPDGVTVLYGPSGSGKTTILKAIAGLIRPRRIAIDFSGERLDRIAPERRRIAMVFQDDRLFPAMTVRENLLYGLKRVPSGVKQEIAGHIYLDETVALLGLQKLLARYPAGLSGGERQRVAIGRALLSQPRLLLMDEPLSGLDAAMQDSIMPYLMRLHESVNLPIVYVTHSMREVVRLADHLVLLEGGRVVAQGMLSDLASRVDLPLAGREDAAGVLNGYVHSHDEARFVTSVACGGLVFTVPLMRAPERMAVRLRVPAREVIVARDAARQISVENVVPAVVVAVAELAAAHSALVELDVGGGQLLARITMDAVDRLGLRAGMRVLAMVPAMGVQVLM
jgi:molybdate transport system ATP-binding protein